jgi:hypothetical protein
LLDITYNIIDTHVSIVDKLETTELNQIIWK